MKTAITLLFSLLLFAGYTQQLPNTITGYVKDAKNEAVAGATVQLLKAMDSSRIKSIVTGENGRFQFNNASNGSYLLLITAVGQKKFISASLSIDSLHRSIALPAIILLAAKRTELAEVVVKARRPLIVQEIDKTVVNVESMISSASSNTLEVLEKTPGVTVTANGDISLNGRSGILVLIDGRATYMSGQDLAAYLKSLPGSLLDKIELIDNPPAKYDAAGNGIINIRLKKNRAAGFTGNISVGYTQGKYARNNDAINLNYTNKKINLFGNIGYNYEKNYSSDVFDRRFYTALDEPAGRVSLINRQQSTIKGGSANFGADYTASANTSFGIVLNTNLNRRRALFNYSSESFNAGNQPDSSGTGSTESKDKRTNLGVNLNVQHKFGETGREFSAEANYLHYTGNSNQYLQNFVYLPGSATASSSNFLYLLPADINIYTIKADYLHPLTKKIKLETGIKSSVVDNNNIAAYYNVKEQAVTINNSQSNHFIYHENINAVYVNGQAKWKRFGAQLGLRAENTQASGHQLGNDSVKESRFTKNYTQFFPSVFLNYKMDSAGKNTLTVSLTRRINRPNYQLLNPFLFLRDKYSYSGGNPLLTPQYQYRYEIRWQHKQFLRMALSYNRFSDVIFQTTEAVGDVFITKPGNIAKGYMLLLNTGLNVSPAKWWNINADILLSYMGLRGMAYSERIDFSTYVARINLLNQWQFGKGWTAEAGAYYASRDLNGQTVTSSMIRANAAIQKKIWKDKGSIRLGVDDIFHSWVYHNKSISLKQAQYFQTGESDTRRIGIAFTYRFGKNSFTRKNKNRNDASDEEKARVN